MSETATAPAPIERVQSRYAQRAVVSARLASAPWTKTLAVHSPNVASNTYRLSYVKDCQWPLSDGSFHELPPFTWSYNALHLSHSPLQRGDVVNPNLHQW